MPPSPAPVVAAPHETAVADPITPLAAAPASEAPVEAVAALSSAPDESGANPGAAGHESPARRATAGATPVRSQAEQIVKDHLPLAVGAGMIPVPGLDLAAIGSLQLKVLASLAKHYKVPFTQGQAQLIVTSLLGSVGTTLLAGAALASAAKFVPFFGTVVGVASMPVAGGVITRAMGHLAIDHFEAGGTMETFDLDIAQEAFLQKIAEARTALR